MSYTTTASSLASTVFMSPLGSEFEVAVAEAAALDDGHPNDRRSNNHNNRSEGGFGFITSQPPPSSAASGADPSGAVPQQQWGGVGEGGGLYCLPEGDALSSRATSRATLVRSVGDRLGFRVDHR